MRGTCRVFPGVRRSIAVLIAMLCCQLSFCHQLVTAGPKYQWDSFDFYSAQTFVDDWKCEVATATCVLDNEYWWSNVRGVAYLALICTTASVLLAVSRKRRLGVAIGIVGFASLVLVHMIQDGRTPTVAMWISAGCPLAIAITLEIQHLPSRIARAFLVIRR